MNSRLSMVILVMALMSVGSLSWAADGAMSVYKSISDRVTNNNGVEPWGPYVDHMAEPWGPFLQDQFKKFFAAHPKGTIKAGGMGLVFYPNETGAPEHIEVFIPPGVGRRTVNSAIKNARASSNVASKARRSAATEAAKLDKAATGDTTAESDIDGEGIPDAER